MSSTPGRNPHVPDVPRPTRAQTDDFTRNKTQRWAAWIVRRFVARFGEVPEGVRAAYLQAIAQTADPPEVAFGKILARLSPSTLQTIFKQVLERAAWGMTPAEIVAEAQFDPVIAWGLAHAYGRRRDDRPTELSWWMNALGVVGSIAEGITDVYAAMGESLTRAASGLGRVVGGAAGGGLSSLLSGLKPLLPWALGAYLVYEWTKSSKAAA